MQETFERHGIQFTESKTEGIGVKLRSSIWQLSPVDPSSLNWKASIYCGDLIIRAASERRAREIAGLALAIAVGRVPGGNTITNPWNRLVAEATCERLSKSAYEEDGPDAILSPEEYERLRQFKAYSNVVRVSQSLRESGISASELYRTSREQLERRL